MDCPYCEGKGTVEPNFAARLRAARNGSNLTQTDAAPKLGVSRAQLANLESGRSEPSMKVFIAATNVYGQSPNWFLGKDDK